MDIIFPLLNFTVMIEMTTNIEDIIFMEITDVTTTNGIGLSFNGTGSPIKYSSSGNGEIDRVALNYGFVSVRNNFNIKKFRLNL